MRLADDDVLLLGHRYAKIDLEEVAAPVSRLRSTDHHTTARDAVAESFEALRLLGDRGSNLLRRLAVLKRDFDWHLHRAAPYFLNGFDALLIGPHRRARPERRRAGGATEANL
jgi:hypothetical protein